VSLYSSSCAEAKGCAALDATNAVNCRETGDLDGDEFAVDVLVALLSLALAVDSGLVLVEHVFITARVSDFECSGGTRLLMQACRNAPVREQTGFGHSAGFISFGTNEDSILVKDVAGKAATQLCPMTLGNFPLACFSFRHTDSAILLNRRQQTV
jgi:hypothetical protein